MFESYVKVRPEVRLVSALPTRLFGIAKVITLIAQGARASCPFGSSDSHFSGRRRAVRAALMAGIGLVLLFEVRQLTR